MPTEPLSGTGFCRAVVGSVSCLWMRGLAEPQVCLNRPRKGGCPRDWIMEHLSRRSNG